MNTNGDECGRNAGAGGVSWSALAKRSGDGAFGMGGQSGVAFSLPPQSKTRREWEKKSGRKVVTSGNNLGRSRAGKKTKRVKD
jgi:hypothetical protein